MNGKKVSETAIIHRELMFPSKSNPSWFVGNRKFEVVNGGAILNLTDNVAGLVALRHCRTRAVTASIDRMDFLTSVHVGDLLVLKASVNYTGKKSLEIGVRVEVENIETGLVKKTGSAYLTFVGVDGHGNTIGVPPIIPETEDEKRRYKAAEKRKTVRKLIRAAMIKKEETLEKLDTQKTL